jgi:hypothetical protein
MWEPVHYSDGSYYCNTRYRNNASNFIERDNACTPIRIYSSSTTMPIIAKLCSMFESIRLYKVR